MTPQAYDCMGLLRNTTNEARVLDLSVLMATRDRARLLEETLDYLRRQDLPGIRWELIVVDNGSVDETPFVLARSWESLPLVTLHEPQAGKNRALNKALAVARGNLLVFTDDDVIPDSRWILELVAASRRWPEHSIFGGRIIPIFPPGTPPWLLNHPFIVPAFSAFSLPQGEGPMDKLPYGPNFAVRSHLLAGLRFCEQIGPQGRNYAMGSESELLQRLQAKGENIIYVPSAVVKHHVQEHQIRVSWLLGRSFRYGRGMVRLGYHDAGRSVYLFGAPRYLWRMVASAWMRYLLSVIRNPEARFDAGRELYYLRGCIYEHRVLTRERRAAKGSVESLLQQSTFEGQGPVEM